MTTRNEDDNDENNGKYCALFCFISTYCIILNLTVIIFSSRSHDSTHPVAAAIGSPISMVLSSLPSLISTSGSKLINDDAIEAINQDIFPFGYVVTPNKFKARPFWQEIRNTRRCRTGSQRLARNRLQSCVDQNGRLHKRLQL
jgi:hypothetical protein